MHKENHQLGGGKAVSKKNTQNGELPMALCQMLSLFTRGNSPPN